MNQFQHTEIISELESIVKPLGYECREIEWEVGSSTLRVYLDNPSGGKIEICDCVKVSRELEGWSSSLAEHKLEISSPGVERPLRLTKHFEQVLGQHIKLILIEKIDGKKLWVGELLAVSDDMITLRVQESLHSIPRKLVHKGNLVFDWKQC